MQTDIHPTFYPNAHVRCACGHEWETGSTKESIVVEVCSQCHPFWTGEQRIVDTEGRVERLRRRFNLGQQSQDG